MFKLVGLSHEESGTSDCLSKDDIMIIITSLEFFCIEMKEKIIPKKAELTFWEPKVNPSILDYANNEAERIIKIFEKYIEVLK